MLRKAVLWPAAALAYGLLLSFIPLLRELHFLSAGLTALLGAFAAAWYAGSAGQFKPRPASGLASLLRLMLLSLLPVIPLFIAALWRGCFTLEGLSFWLLLPPPSVMFGFAVGRYFSFYTTRPALFSISLLLTIALGGLLFELLSYPQVYFHNHVWGYWPGPIYDEQVALTPAVLYFRLITLSWAGLFWLLPSVRLGRVKQASKSSQSGTRLISILLLLSLMLSYSNLSQNGIISPPEYLQARLGGQTESRFALIYHDASLNESGRRRLSKKHDFHIREIARRLDLNPEELPRIHSYIYRHQWQKKRLTGAGNTVYVPVWQSQPQLHVQQNAVDAVLRHELVHVIAREFGMPVLNASPNIALIEGLAVALESPRNTQATIHQIIAAQPELPPASRMRRLMSPTGFYALSGTLSYTLAGSFVDWLLHEYPVGKFKAAYRSGRVQAGYEEDFESLIAGWHEFLRDVQVDDSQLAVSSRVFSAPGIAEKSCVFHISAEQRVMETARQLVAERADAAAHARLSAHAARHTDALSADFLRLWGGQALQQSPDAAAAFLDIASAQEQAGEEPRIRLLKADAHFITQDHTAALALLESFPENEQGELPEAVRLRMQEDIRPLLFRLRYGAAASDAGQPAYAQLPEALRPYMMRSCARPAAAEAGHCSFPPPDHAFEYQDIQRYRLKEAHIRRLLAQGKPDRAREWMAYLETGLQETPAADVVHAARFLRLEELRRLSYAERAAR